MTTNLKYIDYGLYHEKDQTKYNPYRSLIIKIINNEQILNDDVEKTYDFLYNYIFGEKEYTNYTYENFDSVLNIDFLNVYGDIVINSDLEKITQYTNLHVLAKYLYTIQNSRVIIMDYIKVLDGMYSDNNLEYTEVSQTIYEKQLLLNLEIQSVISIFYESVSVFPELVNNNDIAELVFSVEFIYSITRSMNVSDEAKEQISYGKSLINDQEYIMYALKIDNDLAIDYDLDVEKDIKTSNKILEEVTSSVDHNSTNIYDEEIIKSKVQNYNDDINSLKLKISNNDKVEKNLIAMNSVNNLNKMSKYTSGKNNNLILEVSDKVKNSVNNVSSYHSSIQDNINVLKGKLNDILIAVGGSSILSTYNLTTIIEVAINSIIKTIEVAICLVQDIICMSTKVINSILEISSTISSIFDKDNNINKVIEASNKKVKAISDMATNILSQDLSKNVFNYLNDKKGNIMSVLETSGNYTQEQLSLISSSYDISSISCSSKIVTDSGIKNSISDELYGVANSIYTEIKNTFTPETYSKCKIDLSINTDFNFDFDLSSFFKINVPNLNEVRC